MSQNTSDETVTQNVSPQEDVEMAPAVLASVQPVPAPAKESNYPALQGLHFLHKSSSDVQIEILKEMLQTSRQQASIQKDYIYDLEFKVRRAMNQLEQHKIQLVSSGSLAIPHNHTPLTKKRVVEAPAEGSAAYKKKVVTGPVKNFKENPDFPAKKGSGQALKDLQARAGQLGYCLKQDKVKIVIEDSE